MRSVFYSALACLSIIAKPLAAKEPALVSLPKASKWEMIYDKDSCHLVLRLGSGKTDTTIKLTRYEPGDSFDLTLYGKPFEGSSVYIDTEMVMLQGHSPMKREATLGYLGKKTPVAMISSVRIDGRDFADGEVRPKITAEQEATATAIDLRFGRRNYRLETGSLGKPMEAMRACTSDLVRHWGYDPEQQDRLGEPARPLESPGRWLRSSDYPNEALLNGANGFVQFRLDLDAQGQATGCRVLFRTNPDEFSDLTCKLLMKRARMAPALDAGGVPVRSFFIGKVRWLVG